MFRLMVGQGLALSAIGIVAGLVFAITLTRAMDTMLVGVKPTDPVTFVCMAAGFPAVASIASFLPARRTAALRDE